MLFPIFCSWSFAENLPLPTPIEHYKTFQIQQEVISLLAEVTNEYPHVQSLMAGMNPGSSTQSPLSRTELKNLMQSVPWTRWRHRIQELLLHGSQVLEIFSARLARWKPLTHDALLLFLHGMSEEQLLDRVVGQLLLPQDAERSERLLAFVNRTPTLQKMGQILARNPEIPADFRQTLTVLENEIQSTSAEELAQMIRLELGPEVVARHHLTFADRVLAEGSVGAVIEAAFFQRGRQEKTRAACKLIKPYAVRALREELSLLQEVSDYLTENSRHYELGDVPLSDIFAELRRALSKEVLVTEEQANLKRAARYYEDSDYVQVPAVFSFSNATVTCMEFIDGRKITDAYPGNLEARRRLARRLSDALTFDVLFSGRKESIFHGDPHPGNVFSVRERDRTRKFRIALLDWGLSGKFTQQERKDLAQLLVGVYLRDEKRLRRHARVFIDRKGPLAPEDQRQIDRVVTQTLRQNHDMETFGMLQQMVTQLAEAGYKIPFHFALFVKSQVTAAGMLKELDAEFSQDDHIMNRLSDRVMLELPKRLLFAVSIVGWNSHSYRSLLSNEDVKDIQMKRAGSGLRKGLRGFWRGVSFPFRKLAQ